MDMVLDWLSSGNNIGRFLWSIIWLFGLLIINKVIGRIIFKAIKDNRKYHATKKWITYTGAGILAIIWLGIWMDASLDIATYAGLLSAGIAIALRDLFSNIAGWMFISLRKPFEIGHRIMIHDQKGDVIDIRVFQFTLMEVSSVEDGEQSTGRMIDVPNAYILTHPLHNYTKGFEYIWNEIKVLLTFESDWKLAKDLFEELLHSTEFEKSNDVNHQIRNASKKFSIYVGKLTPIIYMDVKDNGVQLTLRYLCAPKQRRNTVNVLWSEILEVIEANESIELAYPTRRVVNTVDKSE